MSLFGKIFRSVAAVATGGASEIFGAAAGGGGSSGGGGTRINTNTGQDAQVGASEQGQSALGSTVGRDNAVTLAGGSQLNTGLQLGPVSGNVTVQGAAGAENVAATLVAALNNQAAAQASNLDTVLKQIGTLAESKQTDGVSGLSKTALWGFGILCVVLIVWIFNRRKA